MPSLCNVDGTIVAEAEARVPVLDRGFLFGDSIYEVIRTDHGELFAWPEHLARLRASAAALRFELDLDDRTILVRVVETVQAAGFADSYVRIVVTRGVGSAPNIDLSCATGRPCWIVLVRELPPMSGKTARLVVIDRLRNDRRALDPACKSGNYLNNVLGLAEAKALGATDAVFVNGAGFVTEASTSNVFVWIGGRLVTPPLTAGILAGITRALLIEFCRHRGIAVDERDVTPAELRSADDLFLSSTLRDVGPVTHLDGRPLHGGAAGAFATDLGRDFAAHCTHLTRQRYAPHASRVLRAAQGSS